MLKVRKNKWGKDNKHKRKYKRRDLETGEKRRKHKKENNREKLYEKRIKWEREKYTHDKLSWKKFEGKKIGKYEEIIRQEERRERIKWKKKNI